MLSTGGDVYNRWELLNGVRKNWDNSWYEISEHMTGFRNFQSEGVFEQGRKRFQRIYDTTGLNAGNFLAGTLHGMMTNPASRWFHLETRPELMEVEEVRAWLEHADDVMQQMFRRREYCFLTAMAEAYAGIVFYGTADVYVEDVPGVGPMFYCRPLQELYFDESQNGLIDTVYRVFHMTARQLYQKFGNDIGSTRVRQASQAPMDRVKVLHAIHPRIEGGPRDRRPWRSVFVDFETKKIIREGGYWTMPHAVGRWQKDAGEIYGRSPGWTALSDQKTLNQFSKYMLEAAELQVRPPMQVPDDGVLSAIDRSPNGITVTQMYNERPPIMPLLPPMGTPVVTQAEIQARQQMVQRAFLMDILASGSDPRMTATQVVALDEQIARLMVPMLGRIQCEVIEPLLERTLDIGSRGGLIAPRPDILRGEKVRAAFFSPLERVQRQAEARAVLGVWAGAGQIAATNPEVLDNLDPDESALALAQAGTIPPKIVRSLQDREETREIRAIRQQQQEAAQQFDQGVGQAAQLLPAVAKIQEAQAA